MEFLLPTIDGMGYGVKLISENLRIGDEEHLLWCELGQSWESWFCSLALNGVLVSPERLVDPSVVRDVLPLGVLPVQVGVLLPQDGDQLGHGVVAILVNEALGLAAKSSNGFLRPPRGKTASAIVLATLVVEAVGDLVSNHLQIGGGEQVSPSPLLRS